MEALPKNPFPIKENLDEHFPFLHTVILYLCVFLCVCVCVCVCLHDYKH